MSRHPWRTRARLLALIDAVAGVATALGAVAVVAGVAGDVDAWTSVVAAGVAAAVDFVAFLANVGIVQDGESQTTPVADPLGPDLLPLLPFRRLEELMEAASSEDLDKVRKLLGQVAPH